MLNGYCRGNAVFEFGRGAFYYFINYIVIKTGKFAKKKNIKTMSKDNTLLQVSSYGMGQGSQELALQLFGNYLNLSLQDNRLPKIIVFYNEGVKLVCKGSPVIEFLKQSEAEGVKILACKTCLNYYNIIDEIEVGQGGTMADIITLQAHATKIISL